MTDTRKPIFDAFREFMGGLAQSFSANYLPQQAAPVASVVHRVRGCSDLSREIGDGKQFPLVADFYGISPVAPLSDALSPPAIVRTVILIIVDAVKRVRSRGPGPHVCIKGVKVIPPPLTNPDSPTTPVRELLELWIETAGLHAGPNLVLGRAPVGLTVVLRRMLGSQTAATAGTTTSQIVRQCQSGAPAITNAVPSSLSSERVSLAHHYQSSEPKSY